MQRLSGVVATLPVGTNLGVLSLLWTLVSGRLLQTRGAVIPALSLTGLPAPAVRRAWAVLGQGHGTIAALLTSWPGLVQGEGHWQAHRHAGYQPLAVDVTGCWRPRLRGCPTTHYDGRAGKALPAIPLGIVARVGSVGGQRLALPLALVRADATDPSLAAQERALLRAVQAVLEAGDVPVLEAGFSVRRLQEAGVGRYLVREAKTVTARRTTPPPYRGRGRVPTGGTLVRPLARTSRGRRIAATPADWVTTWPEGATVVRAAGWADLLLVDGHPGAPRFRIVAIHDPRWTEPLLLASPLALPARVVRDRSRDRWPVEQLPLAAKQLIGAARQFVSAPETCQRLPELALLAGSILTDAAATQPARPAGFWDRRPLPTPGRLRRVLAQAPFPQDFPLPARVRRKYGVTDHLPTGFWGQRRHPKAAPAPPLPAQAA